MISPASSVLHDYYEAWEEDHSAVSQHVLFKYITESGGDFRATWDDLKFNLDMMRARRDLTENPEEREFLKEYTRYLARDLSQCKKIWAMREAQLELRGKGRIEHERPWQSVWEYPDWEASIYEAEREIFGEKLVEKPAPKSVPPSSEH